MTDMFDFLSNPKPENFVPKPKAFGVTELDKLPLTMTYTPMQKLSKIYEPDMALNNGTLFPELDKPFYGSKY